MRYIYQNVVQDGRGNFVASATVTVTLAGGTTKASIYSALTGGTVDADGIITTGTDGTFTFYVDEANYSHSQQFRIVWSKSGYTSETWDYIQIFPDGDRTLLSGSTVDQGDNSIVGTLAWHVADISTDSVTVTVLPGTYDLTTAVTLGSTINLDIKKGGVFKPQAGITLTAYSPSHIIAFPRQQIIDITNNSTNPLAFTNPGKVYPDYFTSNAIPGTTDMNAAITIASVASSYISLNPDTYYSSDDISISKDLTINGNGAIIDFADTKHFIFTGTVGAGVQPGASITASDKTITIATVFAEGDVLWLEGDDSTSPAADLTLTTVTLSAAVTVTASAAVFAAGNVGKNIITDSGTGTLHITGYTSTTEVTGYISNNNAPSGTSITSGTWSMRTLFSPTRPYYERGELFKVLSYTGGVATLESGAIEAYTDTEALVYKITPYKLTASNLTITGDIDSDGLFDMTYSSNSILTNLSVQNEGTTASGIYIEKSFGIEVQNSRAESYYGILLQGCQDVKVLGGDYRTEGGHAVEFSSGTNTPPSRRITVDDVTATATSELYAINTHAGVSEVSFKNSVAIGGAALYGQNSKIENSTIIMNTTGRIALRLRPEVDGDYMVASGNSVVGGTGIQYLENFAGVGVDEVNVLNNNVIAENGFVFGVNSSYDAIYFATKNLTVSGNSFVASAGNAFDFDAGSKVGTTDAQRMVSVRIVNNTIKSTSHEGLNFDGNYKIITLSILNNRIESAAAAAGFDIEGARHIVVIGNEVYGAGAGGSTNTIDPDNDSVICTNNLFRNFTADNGLAISNTTARRNNVIGNNHFDTVAGGAPDTERYPFITFNNNINRWSSSDGAPEEGTYTVGDIVWNDAPASAGTIGWVCTTAGTPGTWKTWGVIG